MYSFVVTSMSLIAVGLVIAGLAMELNPAFHKGGYRTWFAPTLVANLAVFVLGMIGLLVFGVQEAMATADAVAGDIAKAEPSIGIAIGIIAVSLPTMVSIFAAGTAVTKIGTAALAVVAEKPEIFGRTLIYLGLAEGLAIYGLVLSILMLAKI